jgi:transcriptional regulator GlxA family with amidase domain
MHRIQIVIAPPAPAFDLAVLEQIFGHVSVDSRPAYEIRRYAPEPGVGEASEPTTAVPDTIIAVGPPPPVAVDPRALAMLRRAARAGSRVASVCSGVFLLAEAGLLDGRTVTTHWQYRAALAAAFPAVDVHPDAIFVQDGPVLTAAGGAAAIDLYVHLIRADHGAEAADRVARLAIAAPLRPGHQPQVVDRPVPARGAGLADTRAWALRRLDQPVGLTDLARHAHTSIRTLTRRFRAETGHTPLQWLLQQRIGHAELLLETTDLPVERIARDCGLGTADSLRRHLMRHRGMTPSACRAAHRQLRRTSSGKDLILDRD